MFPRRRAHLPEDRRVALRIGVNIGDVVVEDGDLLHKAHRRAGHSLADHLRIGRVVLAAPDTECGKPVGERSMPSRQALGEEAIGVLVAWRE